MSAGKFANLLHMLRSRLAATAGLSSMVGTGGYVWYNDKNRYPRISLALKRGSILAPLKDNPYETTYFRRPHLEDKLEQILSPTFTNQYYLVNGEVGTGKTRTVVEMVRHFIKNDDGRHNGAPIYVIASQGKSLADSLAEAIDFSFDEHISFQFFINYLLKIHSFPGKDDHNKMNRVLDAIEKAAFYHMRTEGKPSVIIIDGISSVGTCHPEILEKLQEKAKLWADCNIVKLVFISNDEMTEELLQKNSSNWSRAAAPLQFGDMTKEDSMRFLTQRDFFEAGEKQTGALPNISVDTPTAEAIFDLVGGRIQDLISCKRDILSGVPLDLIVKTFKEKEREKFLHLKKTANVEKALRMVLEQFKQDKNGVLMAKLVTETSWEDIHHLLFFNIVKIVRTQTGMFVCFESRITENVVTELEFVA